MRFKRAGLEDEFAELHPEVKRVVSDLDVWCVERGLPEVVISHALRTPSMQEDIYWRKVLKERPHLTEPEARKAARSKFSWHLVACAVDIRNTHYSADQLLRITDWLKQARPGKDWEILSHDVGHGNHLHIGCKDEEWRKGYAGNNGVS